MAIQISIKRLQIDRAKTVVVGSAAAATFMVIFSAVASKALLSQRGYQGRVIKEQAIAVKQLNININAVNQLVTSYKQFVEQPTNVLGGNSTGQGDRDGDNAKIILDALPSKYDAPALASSLEKILVDRNFKVSSLSVTDDEIAQAAKTTSNSSASIEIPFTFSAEGSYDSLQALIDVLQRSTRPFKVQTLSLSGKNNSMQLSLAAQTYYLPEKQLNFPTKEVK